MCSPSGGPEPRCPQGEGSPVRGPSGAVAVLGRGPRLATWPDSWTDQEHLSWVGGHMAFILLYKWQQLAGPDLVPHFSLRCLVSLLAERGLLGEGPGWFLLGCGLCGAHGAAGMWGRGNSSHLPGLRARWTSGGWGPHAVGPQFPEKAPTQLVSPEHPLSDGRGEDQGLLPAGGVLQPEGRHVPLDPVGRPGGHEAQHGAHGLARVLEAGAQHLLLEELRGWVPRSGPRATWGPVREHTVVRWPRCRSGQPCGVAGPGGPTALGLGAPWPAGAGLPSARGQWGLHGDPVASPASPAGRSPQGHR